jgi:hypothetical protein
VSQKGEDVNSKSRGLGLFIGGVVTALVLSGGVAVAANGNPLLIGRDNNGTKTTELASKGSALKLRSTNGKAPLAVSNSKKVLKLNADKLDGRSSESFASANARTGWVSSSGVFLDVNGDGTLDTIAAAATCPAGSRLTGGGLDNFSSGIEVIDAPTNDGTPTWLVASTADPALDVATDVTAFAVCWNPTGPVAGANSLGFRSTTSPSEVHLSARDKERIAKVLARQ